MELKSYLQKGAEIVAINLNEELHATVMDYDDEENVLELDNVFDSKSNYQYDSVIFINISNYNLKLKESTTSIASALKSIHREHDENPTHIQRRDAESCSDWWLDKEECFRIERMISNAKKIPSYNSEDYTNAIEFLEMENEFSLLVEKRKVNDSREFDILCLATWNQIFIFDFPALDFLNEKLKDLLESKSTKKIIYSEVIVLYFKKSLSIDLKGVLVLTDFFAKSKNPKDFGSYHLNLRNFIFKYLKRPTKRKDLNELESLSELAILQLKLFDMNLHGFILKKFYNRHSNYAQVLANLSDCEAACLILSNQEIGKDAFNPTDETWKVSCQHLK